MEGMQEPRPQHVKRRSNKSFTAMQKENKAGEKTRFSFVVFIVIVETIIILLYGFCCTYDQYVRNDPATDAVTTERTKSIYPFYQDIHVMMFIGFGFLMTYLRTNSWSSVGINFMVAAFAIQLYILTNGLWHNVITGVWSKIPIHIDKLVTCDFAAAAVLISYGGILGKVSPFQLMFMSIFEVFFYSLNESLLYVQLQVLDIGGSIIIHTFGAYFGLIVTWIISPPAAEQNPNNASSRNSNLFGMIGTLFLFMYWPSFNGATGTGSQQVRAIVNTILSLTGSCLSTFLFSALFRGGRFNMEDVLNASLAGGVAIGASADLIFSPWVAVIIGLGAGSLSTYGFNYIGQFLIDKLRIMDTAGIHHLHGMPGISGGFISIFVIAGLTYANPGYDPMTYLPNRRSTGEQAITQLAGIGITIGLAVASGALTGFLLKLKFLSPPADLFDDRQFWVIDEGEVISTTNGNGAKQTRLQLISEPESSDRNRKLDSDREPLEN